MTVVVTVFNHVVFKARAVIYNAMFYFPCSEVTPWLYFDLIQTQILMLIVYSKSKLSQTMRICKILGTILLWFPTCFLVLALQGSAFEHV